MNANLERDWINYCTKYFIPQDYLFEILEDSKVVPMIRGKATEYNAYLFLKEHLNPMDFDVQKLNLNPQPNTTDEDVSITHRMTGIRLMVEVKNACRGDFNDGKRSKVMKGIPHFKVKCHKSRSNIEKADSTNDRYLLGEFDLLVANPLNAIYEGATFTRSLQFIDDRLIQILKDYYKVSTRRELEVACNQDWRFAFPEDIAEDCNGIMAIPRTPYVALSGDPHWFGIDQLAHRLEEKAIEKLKAIKSTRKYNR